MGKTKDPAFLFYPADFMVGTRLFSFEQKGKYLELLCLQHQQGHLSEEDIDTVCGGRDPKIFAKFVKDEQGLFYNVRLEEEMEKRAKFVGSRQSNGALGGRPKKPKQNLSVSSRLTYAEPSENLAENENININNNIFPFSNNTTTTTTDNIIPPIIPPQVEENYLIRGARTRLEDVCEDPNYEETDYYKFHRRIAEEMYGAALLTPLHNRYTTDRMAEEFTAYNAARGWLGLGGELILKDEETLYRYIQKWCDMEERKMSGGYI